jgi:hypothetical protein
MRRFLRIVIVAAGLLPGLDSINVARQPFGFTVFYRDGRYGLTFFLPASWRGYSVSIQQIEDTTYSTAQDEQITVGQTAMITLRHPQWQARAPHQDIPILIFTRAQWDALHHGELWPSIFAGGTMDELWHSPRFVFAMSSRYNSTDEVSGRKEVAEIVKRNRAANQMPHLYLE